MVAIGQWPAACHQFRWANEAALNDRELLKEFVRMERTEKKVQILVHEIRWQGPHAPASEAIAKSAMGTRCVREDRASTPAEAPPLSSSRAPLPDCERDDAKAEEKDRRGLWDQEEPPREVRARPVLCNFVLLTISITYNT